MGVFSDRLEKEVRLEYMRPAQVREAMDRNPAIYVPFGSIEWHGHHNAVGLDGLKTHEQLVGLALRGGGVVHPTVYFSSGGRHGEWPCTLMVDRELMIPLVVRLLGELENKGYKKAILLSGHYPNRDEYLKSAVKEYLEAGGRMKVLALIEKDAPEVRGDHAAKYETSSMLYLHPETVEMDRLKGEPSEDVGPEEKAVDWMGKEFKTHPCYGVVGVDPRGHASADVGRENTERLIAFLEMWLREHG